MSALKADFVAGECEAGEEDHDILGDEIKITSDQMDDALLGMREGVEVKKRRQFLWSYDDCFVGKRCKLVQHRGTLLTPCCVGQPLRVLTGWWRSSAFRVSKPLKWAKK